MHTAIGRRSSNKPVCSKRSSKVVLSTQGYHQTHTKRHVPPGPKNVQFPKLGCNTPGVLRASNRLLPAMSHKEATQTKCIKCAQSRHRGKAYIPLLLIQDRMRPSSSQKCHPLGFLWKLLAPATSCLVVAGRYCMQSHAPQEGPPQGSPSSTNAAQLFATAAPAA